MSVQCQVITFDINSASGSYDGGPKTAFFTCGNSLAGGNAWAMIQSINVSHGGGTQNFLRLISRIVPKVTGVNGTQVTVDLDFQYSNVNETNSMTGNVQVLVVAEVSLE